MQEGVLLGVCRGCVCSREWIPRQVSVGGVDTLARIRVTATRDKSKGNCTQPGMDPPRHSRRVGSSVVAGELLISRERDPLREQPDCALHVLYRPHSIFLPNEPFFGFGRRALRSVRKAWFSVCLQIGPPTSPERFFRARSGPGPTVRAGISRNASCIVRHHPRSKRFESPGLIYMHR
ncbi:hypothetical protein Lal_00002414 [Lupinus albus]|nr:hypothetical protein Lal_00002414 [Lupinus albus]